MAGSRLERIGSIYSSKECRNKFINNMEMILKLYEADLVRIKENDEKLEKALNAHVKTSQQTAANLSQRLASFKELFAAYEKKVEGLLRSGAMKLEDRPIWWDIYRAFPPDREPVFYEPIKKQDIKQIFYSEDVIRAKYHKSGLPIGTLNIEDSINKTSTQRFLQMYDTLKKENRDASEETLYEKCLEKFKSEEGAMLKTETVVEDQASLTSMLKDVKGKGQNIVGEKPNLKKIFEE